jgi:hypothetical protein
MTLVVAKRNAPAIQGVLDDRDFFENFPGTIVDMTAT